MKFLLIVVSFLFILPLQAQPGIVPAKMEFAGMQLTITNAARGKIQDDVNKLRKSPTYFQQLVKQANLHFPVIEEVFRQENFPNDFKYLIIQESAFRADAVSTSNAVGYWQFKEGTAKEVGMVVDNAIDERKNLVAATRGAAKYMTKNNQKLDNWIYALLSYNTGLGGVQGEVNKKYLGSKKMEIDKNMHWYVLKFLAYKVAFEDDLYKTPTDFTLTVEEQWSGKSLKQIAKDKRIDEESLASFNRWIKDNKKIPDDKTYAVIIPSSNTNVKDVFVSKPTVTKPQDKNTPIDIIVQEPKEGEAAKDFSETERTNIKYKVNNIDAILAIKGDTPNRLAIAGGIPVKRFLKFNDLESYSEIIPGKTYYLKRKKNRAAVLYHVVKEGEDIWAISQRYGVTVKAIRSKNRMTSSEPIHAGRVLWLKATRPFYQPVEYKNITEKDKIKTVDKTVEKTEQQLLDKYTTKEEPEQKIVEKPKDVVVEKVKPIEKLIPTTKTHTVEAGQTLFAISKLYGVKVDDLIKVNNLADNALAVGQIIIIPTQDNVNTAAKDQILEQKPKTEIIHEVKQGETLYQISKKYNITVQSIIKVNGKTGNDISVGDKLLIPEE